MLTQTKFHEVNTIIFRWVSEGLTIVVTHIYKNNWRNLLKKVWPVRPKTALGIRKKNQEVGDNLSFCVFVRKVGCKTLLTFSVFSFTILVWLKTFFESPQNEF